MVEQRIENPRVAGSIPAPGTTFLSMTWREGDASLRERFPIAFSNRCSARIAATISRAPAPSALSHGVAKRLPGRSPLSLSHTSAHPGERRDPDPITLRMIGRAQRPWRQAQSHSIWVPAFAGRSGVGGDSAGDRPSVAEGRSGVRDRAHGDHLVLYDRAWPPSSAPQLATTRNVHGRTSNANEELALSDGYLQLPSHN